MVLAGGAAVGATIGEHSPETKTRGRNRLAAKLAPHRPFRTLDRGHGHSFVVHRVRCESCLRALSAGGPPLGAGLDYLQPNRGPSAGASASRAHSLAVPTLFRPSSRRFP